MKNIRFFGFILLGALVLAGGGYLVYKSRSSVAPVTRQPTEMAANRAKPALNLDMPSPDAPREKPAEAPVPATHTKDGEVDIASMLAPRVAEKPPETEATQAPNPDLGAPQAKPADVPAAPALQGATPSAPPVPKMAAAPAPSVTPPMPAAAAKVAPPPVVPSEDALHSLKADLQRLEVQVAALNSRPDPAPAIRAEMRQLRADFNGMKNSPVAQAGDFKEQVARVGHNLEAMRALVDTLIRKTEVLETELVELRKVEGKVVFVNQGNPPLVGKTREYATAAERGEIMVNLPGLPEGVTVASRPLSFGEVHQALSSSNSIGGFVRALGQLAEAGYDAHLIIGEPNPRNRPIWLEIYEEKGLTVLHPELSGEAFERMPSRKNLPNVFTTGAYGVTYTKGKPEVYRLKPQSS